MLKLYDYFRSSASYRVRIALNLKNIPHELIPIHLLNNGGEQHSETYTAINPHGLVPALHDDTNLLTQSLAIIEYLDELHPQPPLLPQQTLEKALVRSFALSIAADIHPLNNLRVLQYLSSKFNVSDEDKKKWYAHWVEKGLFALEKQLVHFNKNKSNEEALFCFGNQPTLADICLIPQLYNARRFDCDLSPCPTLVRIDQHCAELPAFKKAYPEKG